MRAFSLGRHLTVSPETFRERKPETSRPHGRVDIFDITRTNRRTLQEKGQSTTPTSDLHQALTRVIQHEIGIVLGEDALECIVSEMMGILLEVLPVGYECAHSCAESGQKE